MKRINNAIFIDSSHSGYQSFRGKRSTHGGPGGFSIIGFGARGGNGGFLGNGGKQCIH